MTGNDNVCPDYMSTVTSFVNVCPDYASSADVYYCDWLCYEYITPTMLVPKMSTVTGYDNVSPDLAPLARPGECT